MLCSILNNLYTFFVHIYTILACIIAIRPLIVFCGDDYFNLVYPAKRLMKMNRMLNFNRRTKSIEIIIFKLFQNHYFVMIILQKLF